jgi:hypothetical protein
MVRILSRSDEKRFHNGMQRQGAWRQASISAAALALFAAASASLSRACREPTLKMDSLPLS